LAVVIVVIFPPVERVNSVLSCIDYSTGRVAGGTGVGEEGVVQIWGKNALRRSVTGGGRVTDPTEAPPN
jgi:hypothetical protein